MAHLFSARDTNSLWGHVTKNIQHQTTMFFLFHGFLHNRAVLCCRPPGRIQIYEWSHSLLNLDLRVTWKLCSFFIYSLWSWRLITVWSCSESSSTHSADAPRHTGSGVPSRKLLMEIKFVAKQHRPKCSLLENNLLVAQQHYLIGCAWRRWEKLRGPQWGA